MVKQLEKFLCRKIVRRIVMFLEVDQQLDSQVDGYIFRSRQTGVYGLVVRQRNCQAARQLGRRLDIQKQIDRGLWFISQIEKLLRSQIVRQMVRYLEVDRQGFMVQQLDREIVRQLDGQVDGQIFRSRQTGVYGLVVRQRNC